MAIKDILTLREIKGRDNKKFQSELHVRRIGRGDDHLENRPKLFFDLTYPSKLIKDLIAFINSNLKNNKMRYKDNEGAIIMQGDHAVGKTHALITVYNLFAHYNIAKEWLDNHNIKFNKFNGFVIQNKSKGCIVSLDRGEPEKIWELIFTKLGAEDFLPKDELPPSQNLINKLAERQDVAILIDDLDDFFKHLRKENKRDLLQMNKEFIINLLITANKNDNLMLFISTLGEEEEFINLLASQELVIREVDSSLEESRFIFYHLFGRIKDEQFRTNILPIIDSYLEKYEESSLSLATSEEFKETLLDYYPFHPEFLKILTHILLLLQTEFDNYKNRINILADLITEYQDKDILVPADLPVQQLKKSFPKLYTGLEAELQRYPSEKREYYSTILDTIFIYNILTDKQATKDNILAAMIHPQLEIEVNKLEKSLDELAVRGKYIEAKDGIYQIKEKINLETRLLEEGQKVSAKEKKAMIKEYITNVILDQNYQFYGENNWVDDGNLNYLLLESSLKREDLERNLMKTDYKDLEYQNSLIMIRANKDIFSATFLELSEKIIVSKSILQEDGEGAELKEELSKMEQRLTELLRASFGDYLKWSTGKEKKLEIYKFDLTAVSIEELIVDRGEIKDYIINMESRTIDLKQFFKSAKRDIRMPIIPTEELLAEVVQELVEDEGFILRNNRLYKSLSAFSEVKSDQIKDEQARNKLMNYLRYDLFGPEYKIYSIDEIPDQAKLEYVIILNDLIKTDNWEEELKEKIYRGREYKNTLLLLKAYEDIFSNKNIEKVKREIVLEKLVKEWSERERVIDRLEEIRQEIFNELSGAFGEYLSWQNNQDGLKVEKYQLGIDDFKVDELMKLKAETIKEELLNEIEDLTSSIKSADFLAGLKKNQSSPLMNEATFYQLLEELDIEDKIQLNRENDKIYSNFLRAVREEKEQLQKDNLKESLAYFIRDNLFAKNYKVWGYEELEDRAELDYLLLFGEEKEDLAHLLEKKVYKEREFQNSIIILRVLEDLYSSENLAKFGRLTVLKRLTQQEEFQAKEELAVAQKEELLDILVPDSIYYVELNNVEGELELRERKVEMANLTNELKLPQDELRGDLLAKLRKRGSGVTRKELFLDYRRIREYPLIIKESRLEQSIDELITADKILAVKEDNKIYGNTSALIKSIVNNIDEEKAKEELIVFIRDEIFNGAYSLLSYDKIVDSPERKYFLVLDSIKQREKLAAELEENLYQNLKYQNNILLYSPQESILKEKYINRMKLVLGIKQAQEKINWSKGQIGRILMRRQEQLQAELESLFGYYLFWQSENEQLQLEVKESDGKLMPKELELAIKYDLKELKRDIKTKLAEQNEVDGDLLLDSYKRRRDLPLIVDEERFYRLFNELNTAQVKKEGMEKKEEVEAEIAVGIEKESSKKLEKEEVEEVEDDDYDVLDLFL